MTVAGWILAVGGGAWMLLAVLRYLWRDRLDAWGGSMQLDMRWMAGTVALLLGLWLLADVAPGWLALGFLAAWLGLIPLKTVLGRFD